MTYDLGSYSIAELKAKMLDAASAATHKYIKDVLGGEDAFACGFAWVNIYPKHKGNTKLGRAEREFFKALGFSKDYTGKRYQMWNPSGTMFQNIDCKEKGAAAAAEVLQEVGISAYMGSRLD